jgi:hypothetical protein
MNPDGDPLGFFQSIPEEEQQCLLQSLGQYRLDEILGGDGFSGVDSLVMEQCISNETFVRVIFGLLVNQVGDLRDDTMACAWDILGDVDLNRLFTGDDSEITVLAIQTIIDVSFCLSDEEVAMAEAAVGIEEFPIAGLRCLAERGKADSLAVIFSDDQFVPSVEMIGAMLECGMEMLGAEDLACVMDALGDGALPEIIAGERSFTFGEILALAGCGLDLEALLSRSSLP